VIVLPSLTPPGGGCECIGLGATYVGGEESEDAELEP
jgi:hypothetical protein